MAHRVNDRELVIEWLGRWGKDWVFFLEVYEHFGHELGRLERQQYVKRNSTPNHAIQYRLTDKAIEQGLKGD